MSSFTWRDTVWGVWRPHTNGRRVRPGQINGQAEYYQWDGDSGPITDKKGRRLNESQSRALLELIPRSVESPQTVINRASESTRHAPEIAEQANSSYCIVSPSTVNRGNPSQYRTPNSSLPQSAASLPEYQGAPGQGLFSSPAAETITRNLTDPTQRRLIDEKRQLAEEEEGDCLPSKHGKYGSVNNSQSVIDVGGQKVPLISTEAPPPEEATHSTSRNGRTYYYDRHEVLIAVAVSSGRPNDRNDRVSETSKQLESLNLQAEAEKTSGGRDTKKPIVYPPKRNDAETPQEPNDNRPPRRDDQVDTPYRDRRQKNSSRNQRRGSTGSRLPPISEQFAWNGIKKIAGDGRGQIEELDERYFVHISKFFCEGRVFSMLWHETDTSDHATEVGEIEGRQYSLGRFQVKIYSTFRRMVVVEEAKGYCLCSPIVTYGRRGLKKDLPASEVQKHTAVHMDDTQPVVDDDERDKGMTKEPIAVHPAKADQKLLPMSRLNFGKVYAVEHNVKVMDVGTIQGDELRKLMTYHNNTFSSRRH